MSKDNGKSGERREQLQTRGLAPSNDREAATFADLEPGNDTAVMRGNSNTTGVTLVEVYQLQ